MHSMENINYNKQKENANLLINSLNDLNAPQRDAINRLVNKAQTREKVAEQLQSAQALNDAMKHLRNSIQNQSTVRQESKYINASDDKKSNIITQLEKSKILSMNNIQH